MRSESAREGIVANIVAGRRDCGAKGDGFGARLEGNFEAGKAKGGEFQNGTMSDNGGIPPSPSIFVKSSF